MVGKKGLGGSLVIVGGIVNIKVEYIMVAWCCHLWRVGNRYRLWDEGLGCAKRQILLYLDILWTSYNVLLTPMGF